MFLIGGIVFLCCNPVQNPNFSAISCSYAAEITSGDVHKEVVEMLVSRTNEERRRLGLPAVVEDQNLSRAAAVRAREQQKQFSHTRPDGTPFHTVFSQFGIGGTRRGENLARGWKGDHECVIRAWMGSDGHRNNMLYDQFVKIGIGYVEVDGVGYWCQLFAN